MRKSLITLSILFLSCLLGQEIDLIDIVTTALLIINIKIQLWQVLCLLLFPAVDNYTMEVCKSRYCVVFRCLLLKMANYHDKERIKYKNKLNESDNEFEGNSLQKTNELSYGKRQSSYWWVGITCFLLWLMVC